VADHLRRLAGLGPPLLTALAACHGGAPAGTVPAACRRPAVVFRNETSRTLEILTHAQAYSPGSGEVLARLAPGDTSAAIPRERARGAYARDAVTGGSAGQVTAEERCLDAPTPQPSAPKLPEGSGLSQARRGGR
jgi:hypothetical protein